MKSSKGYVFLEVVLGIALLGLVVVTALPLLNYSYRGYERIISRVEMTYIGEKLSEELRSDNIYFKSLLENFKDGEEVEYFELEEEDLQKYGCKIINMGDNEYLWELKIIVYSKNSEEKIPNVELEINIPK